jgi:hypothetical protein
MPSDPGDAYVRSTVPISPGRYVILRVPIRKAGMRALGRMYSYKEGLLEARARKVSPEDTTPNPVMA